MTVAKPCTAILLIAVAALSACEKEAETYPISGEQCTETDPVQELDAADCFVPPVPN